MLENSYGLFPSNQANVTLVAYGDCICGLNPYSLAVFIAKSKCNNIDHNDQLSVNNFQKLSDITISPVHVVVIMAPNIQ